MRAAILFCSCFFGLQPLSRGDLLKTDFVNLGAQIQMLWTLACGALVMFMQAGFTCLESGSVREKNSVNVAVKNITDLCVSFPAFS
jgi:hypothetical protein